jgi:hypothetical protein
MKKKRIGHGYARAQQTLVVSFACRVSVFDLGDGGAQGCSPMLSSQVVFLGGCACGIYSRTYYKVLWIDARCSCMRARP